MKRVVSKFFSFKAARRHDIDYYLSLSVDERFAIARELQRRVYGDRVPDIREAHGRKRTK